MDDRSYKGITLHQNEPTNPQAGDMLVGKSGDFLVWAGSEWMAMSPAPIEEDNHMVVFERCEAELFDKHPQLEKLWLEYRVLRKLLTGD